MLYFRDEICAETWEYRVLAAWVVLLNIFVEEMHIIRCGEESLFKAGANADAEARKFHVAGGCNDERFGAGGFVRNSEAR